METTLIPFDSFLISNIPYLESFNNVGLETSYKATWLIFSYICFAVFMKASSTLVDVFADVSMKTRPWSFAKASPSSFVTARLESKSLQQMIYFQHMIINLNYVLFPINMITMFELLCCRASSNQVVKWLKVSRLLKTDKFSVKSTWLKMHLVISYTKRAPAAPR